MRATMRGRTALAAELAVSELAVSELLGMAELAGPSETDQALRDEAREALPGGLVEWAEREATPGALGLLRACEVVAPRRCASTRPPPPHG